MPKSNKTSKTLLKKDAKRVFGTEDHRVVVLKGLFSNPELEELTEALLTNHGCAPETGKRPFAKKDDEPWVRRNRRTKAWGAPYRYAGEVRKSPAFHSSRQGKLAWKVVCRVVKAAKQRLGIDLGTNAAILTHYSPRPADKKDPDDGRLTWHTDLTPGKPRPGSLEPGSAVWSFVLGETRPFYFRMNDGSEMLRADPAHGDVCLMMPDVQELGKHCVEPGQANRASLTGRKILV